MARRSRRWLIVLSLLLVFAWTAPWIVAGTSLRNTVLSSIFSDVRGTVACESASFGWLSPVVVSGVSVVDEHGSTVFSAPHIESEKNLWAILSDRTELGKFTIQEPQVNVAFEPSSSNVEQVFHEMIYGESESSVGIELEITDGTIRLAENDAAEETADEIKLTRLHLVKPKLATDELVVELSALATHDANDGTLDCTLQMHSVESGGELPPTSAGTATLTGSDFPLAVARRIVERLAPNSQIMGTAASNLSFTWNEADTTYAFTGDMKLTGLVVAAPALGTDRFVADELFSEANLNLNDEQLHIEKLVVKSDIGKATAEGRIPLTLAGWQHLADEDFTIQGDLDLVRLARLLPDTLRIREGTEITQGKVRWFAKSYDGPEGRTWKADVAATDLAARHGQQTITWPEPVNVNLAAHRGKAGPVIERMSCRSKFLTIEGSGSLDRLQLTAEADLAQLLADLGRFIDTSGIRLAGVVKAELQSHVAEDRLSVQGTADLTKLEIANADALLWREDAVRADLQMQGLWKDNALATIDAARIDIRANQEHAVLRLEQPITDFANLGTTSLRAGYGGRYGAWPARLATWIGEMPELPFVAGDAVSFDSVVKMQGDTFAWETAKLRITPQASSELPPAPQRVSALEISATGQYNSASGQLQLRDLFAHTAGSTLGVARFDYRIGEETSTPLTIDATLHCDLSQMQTWLTTLAADKPSAKLRGILAGKLQLEQGQAGSKCTVDANIANFVATSAAGQSWQEKQLAIDAIVVWDATAEQWNIERATIAGQDLSAEMRGHVALGKTDSDINLAGEVRYDLAKLSILLQSYLGNGFQMKGRDALTFAVRGKLPTTAVEPNKPAWQQLTGHAKFGWDEATYQGFHCGAVQVDAQLANGQVRLGRVETTVNEGKVAIEPVIHLTDNGPVLVVAKGRVVNSVKITPETCESALKYMLPTLADVAQAEGAFSLELDRCVVPLSQPELADVIARLVVHKAIVSPNQVIGTLAVLQNIPTLVRIEPEDVIPIQVSRGRVYHKDVKMIFARDVEILNSGSVGFDDTLDLLVQMPMPARILGDRPLGASLSRQQIDIRIGGTLDKPKIDPDEVRRAVAKVTAGTANDFLNKELGNALDRLIKRRQR